MSETTSNELITWFNSLSEENKNDIKFAKWTYLRCGDWRQITAEDCGEQFLKMWKFELEQRALPIRTLPPSDGLKRKQHERFINRLSENNTFAHLNDLGLTYLEARAQQIKN